MTKGICKGFNEFYRVPLTSCNTTAAKVIKENQSLKKFITTKYSNFPKKKIKTKSKINFTLHNNFLCRPNH